MAEQSDLIIIGSGINGLVAGALCARAGKKVQLFERNPQLGGAIKTEEATLPGFTHELLSSWHPLFLGGPAYGQLKDELEKRGLHYKNTSAPTGVICQAGSGILFTDPDLHRAEMERLGDSKNWDSFIEDFGGKIDLAFGVLGTDFWRPSVITFARTVQKRLGRRGSLTAISESLEPATSWLDRQFKSEVTKSLLAPWALHNGIGPDDAASAFITKVISLAISFGGMPIPVGGGVKLVDALAGIIRDNGGEIFTNVDISKILTEGSGRKKKVTGVRSTSGEEFSSPVVLASTTPHALYQGLLAGEEKPKDVATSVASFRYGRAAIQIHLALDGKPEWGSDRRLNDVAIVHILDGVNSLSQSVNAANRGYLPSRPTIVVGQPCVLDPSRAPEGKSILWIQLQENPQEIQGDLAGEIDPGDGSWSSEVLERYSERVIDQIAIQIPNLRSLIKAKLVLGPREIEALNINLVGGDPYSGDCRIDQYALWRPLSAATGHKTFIRGLWHIGASTHPGPGLGGGSGYLVAQRLLKRSLFEKLFWR
ncbi:MAG: NAD(P)/FAD-dependent oxidoreductase [Actinomycetota bacterium]|nr:NAD(P)/FAD-dependent oxidoreductase [Actinomycetota bacterium]